jgi:poly(3-hydroxybutyrate) depolymerase
MILFLLSLAFTYNATYDFQGREYQIRQTKVGAPLIAMFHGCNQNADDFYTLTNSANRNSKANIVFVEQNLFWHPIRCWNWFYDYNQIETYTSESDTVMKKLLELKKQLKASSLHVVGFSSGAGLATNISLAYARHINTALIHSGPGFGITRDSNEANHLLETGKTDKDILRPIPFDRGALTRVLLVHGTKDKRVHPNNQKILIDQFRHFLGIEKAIDVNLTKQTLQQHSKRISIWRLPMAHEWAGGNPSSEYAAPEMDDVLKYYYSSVVGI